MAAGRASGSARAAMALLVAVCALFLGPGPAIAAKDEKLERHEKDRVNALKKLQKRIEQEQRALGQVSREQDSAVELLRTVEQRLADEEHALLQAESGVRDAERALSALEKKQRRLGGDLAELESGLADRLVSLYKLREVGYFRILFSSRDYQDLARRTRFLRRIVAADIALISDYQSRFGEVRREAEALDRERRRLSKLREEASVRRTAFDARREKKLALLDRLGREKAVRIAAIKELADAAGELEGAFEALRALEPPPGAASGPRWSEGLPGPEERFSTLRGRIPMPVAGRIIKKFGLRADPTLGTRIRSNGITVRAPYGEAVRAVSAGRVLYAGWFRGYGRILITDHGEGYYTLSAHASELLKQVGDRVAKGEVVARVGDSGSLEGPVLYFEIRERGVAVDPMDWIEH